MRLRRRVERSPATVDTVFAGTLDGRRLWLAVAEEPDVQPIGFELRSPDGRPAPLPVETDDQPGFFSVRIDLATLPSTAYAHDVALVTTAGVRRVHGTPATRRTPLAPGGLARHRLERADDGALRLVTEPVDDAHELQALTVVDDGVVLDLGGRTHPVADADASWSRVVVDDLPVRRRDDDLPEPGRAVPLPSVGRLRLRWSGEGLLQARVVEHVAEQVGDG